MMASTVTAVIVVPRKEAAWVTSVIGSLRNGDYGIVLRRRGYALGS